MDAAPAQDDGEQQFTPSGTVAQAAPAPKSAIATAIEEDEMF
jgi:hypothetical protein